MVHRSRETRSEVEGDQNLEGPESDREPEDLDAILANTIQAIATMDPHMAQRVAESSAGPVLNPPQAGSSASTALGGSSVYGQTLGPQGHGLTVSSGRGHP